MKQMKKYLCLLLCFMLLFTNAAYAHSGRTDAQGGHHDYRNVSGLGSYHYHCGGHPAHLHSSGVCPYSKQAISSGTGKVQKLNKTSATLAKGKTVTLKVQNAGGKKVTWKSSKKAVATVSAKGVVKAKKTGKTTITATVGGKKLTCKIRVVVPTLNMTNATRYEDDSFYLKVKGTSSEVKWSSSNEYVAYVDDDGEVFCNYPGTAVIKAKVNGVTLKCTVVVLPLDDDEDDWY